jgi:hypothetical protein
MARPRKDAQIDLSEARELTAGLIERTRGYTVATRTTNRKSPLSFE